MAEVWDWEVGNGSWNLKFVRAFYDCEVGNGSWNLKFVRAFYDCEMDVVGNLLDVL